MGNEGAVLSLYDQLIKEGYDKGIEKGIEKGVEQGVEAKTREIILRGYKNGFSVQSLAILTGLPETEVLAIIQTKPE